MNFLKKNQMLIYVIALMLVVAGYLNYTGTESELNTDVQTSAKIGESNTTKDIGDAKLVSSNVVSLENTVTLENSVNTENEVTNEVTENSVTKQEENTEDEEKSMAKETSATSTGDSYFTKSKLERETMYSQMLETYEKVLNGINSLETQKQSAAEEIKKINDTKNSIMIAENLITTKGFQNNVIFVNGDSISAIIGAEELSKEEISQIQNILSRELNANIENIHIAVK